MTDGPIRVTVRRVLISIAQRACKASCASSGEGSITQQARRGVTCTIPRVSSRTGASRTDVRETLNKVARAGSPRRVPGGMLPDRIASTITRSIGGDSCCTKLAAHQACMQV